MEPEQGASVYGAELTSEQWTAWSFDPLRLAPAYLQAVSFQPQFNTCTSTAKCLQGLVSSSQQQNAVSAGSMQHSSALLQAAVLTHNQQALMPLPVLALADRCVGSSMDIIQLWTASSLAVSEAPKVEKMCRLTLT